MRRRKSRRTADLDITPLIDVMFMLIIFFVLTASFVNGKLNVELPAGYGLVSPMEGAITVTVEKSGAVFWDGRSVAKQEIAQLAKGAKGREILVAGDSGASYGTIAEVLSILRREGITSAGLLMRGGNKD